MHIRQCMGFYIASFAAVFLGMCILIMTLNGSYPIAVFAYVPSVVFFTVAFIVWIKALDTLINKTLQEPESTLFMSLPVSVQDIVVSKIWIGAMGNFILYSIIAGFVFLSFVLYQNSDHMFTLLSAIFTDYAYSAWIAAVSIGMMPILLLLEQLVFCGLLMFLTLRLGNHNAIIQIRSILYFLLAIGQISFNAWFILFYQTNITHIHPLALSFGLAVLLAVAALILYHACVRRLKYGYEA